MFFKPCNQRNANAVKTSEFCSCYISNLTQLDDREKSVFIFEQWNSILVYPVHVFLFISTYLTTISITYLTFPNFSYLKKKIIRTFLYVPPGDDRIPRLKSTVCRLNSNQWTESFITILSDRRPCGLWLFYFIHEVLLGYILWNSGL